MPDRSRWVNPIAAVCVALTIAVVIAVRLLSPSARTQTPPSFHAVSIQGMAEALPSSGNSLDGLQRALADGVRAVEVDFRLDADADLVTAHNPVLRGNCGRVGARTTAQLRACRLPHGYRLATLPELLEMPFDHIYLDLKDTSLDEPQRAQLAVSRAIEDVRAAGRVADTVLMVYRTPTPIVAALRGAGVRAGLKGYPGSEAEASQMNHLAAELSFELVCVNLGYVTPGVISEARRLGVWHLAWKGEPDPQIVSERVNAGLGGLITKRYSSIAR